MPENMVVMKSVFALMIIWGVWVAFLIFRPRVSFAWKGAAIAIFLFYVWFFNKELQQGFLLFDENWYQALIYHLRTIILVLFYFLFLLWPLVLVVVFYKADEHGAERILKCMVIFTLFLWIVVGIYVYNRESIDMFLHTKITDFFPFLR